MTRAVKAFVLLVALAAMLCVSTVSASPAHWHEDAAAPGRCELCITAAHVVAYETPSVQPLPAPEVSGRFTLPLVFWGYDPVSIDCFCSRGPPALFL